MTQQQQPTHGLALWEAVQTTDPAYTRRFTRASGFEGTAINPSYLVRKATEQFGPIGLEWGVEVVKEEYRDGHIIGFPPDGGVPVRVIVHIMQVEVWYMRDGRRGSVKQFGQTTFVGKTNDGTIYTNEEAPKMSQTDGMCKCLSLLGFGADVHLGLYDDIKYVADLEAAFAQGLLPTARNATSAASGQQSAPHSGEQANSTKFASDRYVTYKNRLMDPKFEFKSLVQSRKTIEADELLSPLEKTQLLHLLGTIEKKLGDSPSDDDQAKPGKTASNGKSTANAIDKPFL